MFTCSCCIESEISGDEDDLPESETIGDRIFALRDMIAPSTRQKILTNVSAASRWTWSGLCFGGRAGFVVVTAVLFYGIPFTLSVAEENSILEMEKEQKMRDEGANVSRSLLHAPLRGPTKLELKLLTPQQMLIQGAENGGEQAKPAL